MSTLSLPVFTWLKALGTPVETQSDALISLRVKEATNSLGDSATLSGSPSGALSTPPECVGRLASPFGSFPELFSDCTLRSQFGKSLRFFGGLSASLPVSAPLEKL